MPTRAPRATPYTSLDALMAGSMAYGMPRSLRMSGSHSKVSRFISIVRLALETSVTCTPPLGPPLRCQMIQVSIVPNRSSPLSALAYAPGTWSRIHLILGPEKYVARGRPTFGRSRSWPPSSASSLQMSSVRVSCQTIALQRGIPVVRSQTTVVSRWLVTPIAAMSLGSIPLFCKAPAMTSWTCCQISTGSCSTQPGRG